MPAKINGSVVTCVADPEQDDDAPASGFQTNGGADVSGSRDESQEQAEVGRVLALSQVEQTVAEWFEGSADTQAPAQEPEQRCDEAGNSVDEIMAEIFEWGSDTQARDPQLSGDPPRQRRRISPVVENIGEDTAAFPDCDDPQFGA